jgi:predicted cation transporter
MADPIPITIAVLISGLLFKWFRGYVGLALARLRSVLPTRVVMAFLITVLALLSSVITVIIASLLLVELISLVRFSKEDEARLTVFACMALGLGAVLTPVGEPLSTIATAKLNQDFWFLLRLLGWWVIPGVVAVGASIAFLPMRADQETLGAADTSDNYRDVLVRAFKVYIFVMALVLLGEGFKPMVDRFIIGLDARILYWINMISAILDNATLTAAEIGPGMHLDQVRAALMGLLISGGMLIPGNIPNIIAANKLGIRSRTWARWGIPLGLALLVLYFVLLFVM